MRIIDISVPVSPDLVVWPGDPKIVLERLRSISKGHSTNDSRLTCSVHSGTHVDAPKHCIENGATVEQLPLKILIGPAWVVELPSADIITPDILEDLAIPSNTTRLLFKTRNSRFWNDPHPNFTSDFVALSTDAAKWIVRNGIHLIGIDYLSVQLFYDPEPLTHQILLEAGVIIVEALNLHSVKPDLYQLICLPMKLVGSDGAPARAVLIKE